MRSRTVRAKLARSHSGRLLTEGWTFAHDAPKDAREASDRARTVVRVSDVLVRQRSLIPTAGGSLEGWMDEDAAAAAGQLFGDGPRGVLVIDARQLLTSTARVVGAQFGALHFKTWMAVVTLHVAHGMPDTGKATSSIGELTRLIYGAERTRGGNNTRHLLRAIFDLRQARFTVPGYDMVNQRPASGASDTSLLISLYVDEAILKAYKAPGAHGIDRTEFGKHLGARSRETIAWQLHPDYTQRLAESDLRRFDWTKAQQLRGVAMALWMVFSSERVPYRRVFEADDDLEMVEVPLTVDHCNALGVRAGADAARRRTLNEAGRRVCEADRSFVEFQAHGGRGRPSFLRVVRRTQESALDRPFPQVADQLSLVESAA
jgi:hypothetical protein